MNAKDPRRIIRDTIAAQCKAHRPHGPEFKHESIEDWMRRTGLTPEVLESNEVPRVGYPQPKFIKRRGGSDG